MAANLDPWGIGRVGFTPIQYLNELLSRQSEICGATSPGQRKPATLFDAMVMAAHKEATKAVKNETIK